MRPYLALLRREGDFRRTYLAGLVSSGGDWFVIVPLLALLPRLTGGGLAGGLVLAADTAVFALLAPYAGTIADRVDRRRLMVTCEALSAGLALLLLLVDSTGRVWIAYLAVGGIAAAKAFTLPAGQAALPNLVPPADLQRANVLNGASWGTMLAVGAALGGLAAAAFGERTCYVIDSVSFVVSALLIVRCRKPFQQPRESSTHAGFRADVAETVAYARSQPRVLALLTAKPGVAFANGALALFPLLSVGVFEVGEIGIGLLFAARGLGALLGPLALGSRTKPDAVLPTLALCIASCGLLYIGVAVAPVFWLVLVLVTLAHVGGGANWMLSSYSLQAVVPNRVLGRISSADFMFVTLAVAANQVVSGLLSEAVSTRLLIGCFGAASVGYAALWWAVTSTGDRRQARTRSLRSPSLAPPPSNLEP